MDNEFKLVINGRKGIEEALQNEELGGEFELTIRGREHIEEAIQAPGMMSALHHIKEYLRSKERHTNWDDKDAEYDLIVKTREDILEIIDNNVKLDL